MPKIEEGISEPPSIKKLINYITKVELHDKVKTIIEEVKDIDSEIIDYPTRGYIILVSNIKVDKLHG